MVQQASGANEHPYIHGDDYLPALLSVLNNRLSSGASQLYLARFGIGINEWRILSVLSNTPWSTATHICDTVQMHKTVASRTIRDMQGLALLRIERRDGLRLIALTPKGQRLHDRIAPIALERERLLLAGLTPAEREQLLRLLRRLRNNLPIVDAWAPTE